MADNEIRDNRTQLSNADSIGSVWVDIAGGNTLTLDTEIKIEGTGSIGEYCTTTRAGILGDAGSAQDWSNNHFYIWFNCAVVGLLDTKANGGVTVRFTGATVTDWFEVYVAGSDDFPTAVSGGWTMFVVDIETARSTAVTNGWTNGTTPATTAIQRVGVTFITATTMPRMVDNCWVDATWRLPDGSPGIIVDGRDQTVSAHDWNWDDIVSTSESNAWGMVKRTSGGAIAVNAPIQFGVTTGTHDQGFSDTNQVILFENQEFAATDLYVLDVRGNASGTQSFVAGNKVGSGDTATGDQGWVISAESSGVRWSFTGDNANTDTVNLMGCTFIHSGNWNLNSSNVEVRNCLFNDALSGNISNSMFAKNIIVNAATADGVALFETTTGADLKSNSFTFSDGHAIEYNGSTPAQFTFTSNLFTNYGADGTNDAAIFNDSGGDLIVDVVEGGTLPTFRNGASSTTTINDVVPLEVTVKDESGNPIQGAQVGIYQQSDGVRAMNETTNSSGFVSENYNYPGSDVDIFLRVRKSSIIKNFDAVQEEDGGVFTDRTTEASDSNPNDVGQVAMTVVNDAIYFGHSNKYGEMTVDVGTIRVGGTIVLEYWNGTSWISITTADNDLQDDTIAFTVLGENIITFSAPSNWVKGDPDSGGTALGEFYYTRVRVTSTLTTAHRFDQVRIGRLNNIRYEPIDAPDTITSDGYKVTSVMRIDEKV